MMPSSEQKKKNVVLFFKCSSTHVCIYFYPKEKKYTYTHAYRGRFVGCACVHGCHAWVQCVHACCFLLRTLWTSSTQAAVQVLLVDMGFAFMGFFSFCLEAVKLQQVRQRTGETQQNKQSGWMLPELIPRRGGQCSARPNPKLLHLLQ